MLIIARLLALSSRRRLRCHWCERVSSQCRLQVSDCLQKRRLLPTPAFQPVRKLLARTGAHPRQPWLQPRDQVQRHFIQCAFSIDSVTKQAWGNEGTRNEQQISIEPSRVANEAVSATLPLPNRDNCFAEQHAIATMLSGMCRTVTSQLRSAALHLSRGGLKELERDCSFAALRASGVRCGDLASPL